MGHLIRVVFLSLSFWAGTITVLAQSSGDEEKEQFEKGKQRDQQEIDEALRGWWSASMKTHSERIAWWKQAKFGMFIHWGVYSLPGGEWKGRKVGGYAEHLMRQQKISRNEYLQIASQFDPVLFDADAWAKMAKEAGMGYLIVTAKHHDGFAMYPSLVSDFSIRERTPFKRDPMAELSSACKKYGIKFGFYYSHAFDWEHPDAPGNDWEYNNPGGDKNLYGGRNWYNKHPELLPKAIKYVNEKAIPQIKELLTKYQPDILWFDTPHKLPFSENLRILKVIRQIAPNVVINGRLAGTSERNYGDYLNTADRPVEFPPATGDWEAIPTTNESYGYSKYDNSHKSAAFFVQLLAKAASRGGNLLMNIGPKGDGTFDTKDMDILKGIGIWTKRNMESIYKTTPSPLPQQNWGVTTMKGNKLYLHVFEIPADKKLYIGGLSAKINKAYTLADKKEVKSKRISPTELVIDLHSVAADTIDHVIVLELKSIPQKETGLFVAPNSLVTRLLAFDAEVKGAPFSFGDGKADRYYIDGWTSVSQTATWRVKVNETKDYRIRIKYLSGIESGGSYRLTLNEGAFIEKSVDSTKKGVVYEEIGRMNLKKGWNTLTLAPQKISGTGLMKLLEIQLQLSGTYLPF